VLDPALEEAAVARARAALTQAEEQLADSRRRLAEAEALASQRSLPETELKSRASEVRSNEAAFALRQAELRRETALLERHEVKAPFEGVISRKLTEVGEWVEPGTPVAELVATENLRVDFRVPQEVFGQLGSDSRIRVELGGSPGRWFEGDIAATVPVSDATARTFLLRVTLDDAEEIIAPGMSAHGRLAVESGRRGVVLPRDALLRYPDGRVVVWVIGEDGTVSERLVETGLGFSGQVEIVRGVEAGERVVLQGNEMLREGQSVVVRDGRG
jgi:RND family efflux transporter MFP subunit